jgi:chloramphenicol-sensitive protein RarD
MSKTSTGTAEESRGIFYAAAAYSLWGIVPLYWRLLGDVPPFETTVHRVVWCAVFATALTLANGNAGRVRSIFSSPRLLGTLALTSVLISSNWTIFIYCVGTNQLVAASLGYYINPLVSFALGTIILGERMSRARLFAVGLAATAVAVQAISLGQLPWIALALALSFGLYGYFRKLAPVAALDGLLIETLILFPITAGLVGFWAIEGRGAFPSSHLLKDALLIGGGPITALPLVLFAAGARRISLTTMGFLQYLSPSITLLLAVLAFHEPFTRTNAETFGCVWTALLVVALEGRFARTGASARAAPDRDLSANGYDAEAPSG